MEHNSQTRIQTDGTQPVTLGVASASATPWQYKVTIFARDGIAASIALMKYRIEYYGEKPLWKRAYDEKRAECIDMVYFTMSTDAQFFWRLLQFVGAKYNHDAILAHYDWKERRLTKIGEQHWHRHQYEV